MAVDSDPYRYYTLRVYVVQHPHCSENGGKWESREARHPVEASTIPVPLLCSLSFEKC
jgi:hypothetical protein